MYVTSGGSKRSPAALLRRDFLLPSFGPGGWNGCRGPTTRNRIISVRKLTFAVAVLASLGAAAITAPASAAPGA
ncbi:hypothetical protein FV226_23690, partial [Methylobacterium sp. WL12]